MKQYLIISLSTCPTIHFSCLTYGRVPAKGRKITWEIETCVLAC